MVVKLYSVRDILNGFGQILCESSEAVALRNFSFAVNNNDVISFSPKDYDLYEVGSYDSDTGTIIPCPIPVLVSRGTDCVGDK